MAHLEKKIGSLKSILYILLLFVSSIGWSQKEWINAAVNAATVTSNDVFTYQISTDCDCDIIAPNLSAFDIIDMESGKSKSFSSFNGQSSGEQCTNTLTYLLRGKKKGKFEIGEAKAKCPKSKKSSTTINIEVLSAEEVHAKAQGEAPYYFNLETNKKSAKIGEPVIIDFYMFTRARPQDITTITSGNAGGVFRQNLFEETSQGFSFPVYQVKVKGNDYYKIHLRQEVILPSAPGKLVIEPYFGRAVERYEVFNAIYMEGYSNGVTIDVKDLPSKRPDNYYGMVGDFELTHAISQTTIAAKHAFELTVKISGTGTFNLFKDPEFLVPESFGATPDEPISNLKISENGLTGDVEYTFILTPTKEGKYNILPYSFGYYSLKDGTFKSVATESFEINVTPGEGGDIEDPNNNSGIIVEDDIRHIHKNNDLFTLSGFFGGLVFWLLILTPLLSVFIFFMIKQKRSRLTTVEKIAQEQKEVKKSVAKSVESIQKSDTLDIRQLKSNLDEYLMTNLSLGRSQLSKASVSTKLGEKGCDDKLKADFESIWSKIEMAQYAPISNENLDQLANDTSTLIKDLNKIL